LDKEKNDEQRKKQMNAGCPAEPLTRWYLLCTKNEPEKLMEACEYAYEKQEFELDLADLI
jgi:hypothetical protein